MVSLLAISPLIGTGRIEIDATQPRHRVSSNLYGIFLEEISNAGEGGLYAELIQNRGFEDANLPPACTLEGGDLATPKKPSFWEGYSKDWKMPWPYARMGATPYWSIQGATMRLSADRPLTAASRHAAEIDAKPGAQLVNQGFWGMNAVKGKRYDLSLFTQTLGYKGPLEGRLIGADGRTLGSVKLPAPGSGWKKAKGTIVASASDPRAKFALVMPGSGKLLVDFVSLMPSEKWRGLPLRTDLANLIADLKPGFVRWPGGCVVEGITIETRPRWEQTIGPLEERVPTFVPWGYWVSNGFGYHEWLEYCEAIEAEPLYVFSAGISCAFRSGTYLPDADLPALIQNTLDAIEYATGPTTTKWGAMRAKNGHPKPFPMHMIEIGNEDQGAKYGERFKKIATAVKAKYPKMKVALSSWIAGIDQRAIDAAGPLEIVDEHAYKPINWAVQNFDAFDKYSRAVPWELYIGEFATNSGVGDGNMLAAIGDSAYMMSMEKNADLVKMGSYAPLLDNRDQSPRERDWAVNLIHFNSHEAFGRASYYACKLFAENRPDVTLDANVAYTPAGEAPIAGPVGIGTYATSAEFKDVQIDGKPVGGAWRKEDGQWSQKDGVYAQTGRDHNLWSYFGDDYGDKTVTLKARRVAGEEGFVVSVGNADGRRVQFNVGGWGNREHGLEAEGVIRQVRGSVETGRWYDVKVVTKGRNVKAYLDDRLVFDETLSRVDTVLSVAGRDEKTGDLVIKVLNTGATPADLDLVLKGAKTTGGTVTRLASDDPQAENSFGAPRQIVPITETITVSGESLKRRFPAYSLSILRLKTK